MHPTTHPVRAAALAASAALVVGVAAPAASAQSFAGFTALPPFSGSGGLRGVVAFDSDLDGDLDVVVSTSMSGGSARLMVNNGRGVFVPGRVYPLVGGTVSRPVLGDFNNDGYPEVVIANSNAGVVSVIRANAAGVFQQTNTYPVAAQPTAVAVGDFNNDGFDDIAALSQSSATVRVLLGNGVGFPGTRTFSTTSGPQNGQGPRSIHAVDLNNDGLLDLVTANFNSNDIAVFYNAGNANFFTGDFAIYVDQPTNPYDVRSADMDNDGDQDLVVARGGSNAQVVWLRNARSSGESFPDFNDGSFATTVGDRVISLAFANLDCANDNRIDVLAANEGNGTPASMQVLINPPSGSLSLRPSPVYEGGSPQQIAVGDFDNDGDNDAVAVDLFTYFNTYLNLCRGTNCPGDFNDDGTINFFDVVEFLSLYNAQSPAADLGEPAGVFNFFDISSFLSLFEAGCP